MFYYNYYKNLFKTYGKAFIKNKVVDPQLSPYLKIGIINPSIGTSNLGDLIIYEAVSKELRKIYPDDFFTNYPSQLNTNYEGKRLMAENDHLFVSGTNLLMSNMDMQSQWKIDPGHKFFLKNKILLMGVGWWQYQNKPNRYTSDLYKSIFDQDHLHSVRDSYTCEMLKEIGINNVVNTTCPTLWDLSPELCKRIPQKKNSKVITTLTFYKADKELDKRLLDILVDNYETVYLWVQGFDDVNYLHDIFPRADRIKLVAPTIEAYNEILEDPLVEYLGTRLHAGVRALQKGVRTLIVAVDNRAVEIAKDTNLNVIKRQNIEEAFNFIDQPYITEIKLPVENIKTWKENLTKKL